MPKYLANITFPSDPSLSGDGLLLDWTESAAYQMTSATYDTTYTSVVSTATVKWPDGSAGTYTTDTINSTWQGIDAYHITHTNSGHTVTQSAITRDSTTGQPTTVPALTIS